MKAIRKKIVIFIVGFLLVFVLAEFFFNFQEHFSFYYLKKEYAWIQGLAQASPWLSSFGFFLFFVLSCVFFLPTTTLNIIAAGVIFGFVKGSLLAFLSSLVGAGVGFLISRKLFGVRFQKVFHSRLELINRQLREKGARYIFLCRMLPGIPFSLTNFLMGLSVVHFNTFLTVSAVAFLPKIFLYVNAGTQIASLQSPSEILSFRVLLSFGVLAFLPWVGEICRGKNLLSKVNELS